MTSPEGREQVELFQFPAWMVQKAAESMARVDLGALGKKLQEARDQDESKTLELVEQAHTKYGGSLSPFKIAERCVSRSESVSESVSQPDNISQCESISQPQAVSEIKDVRRVLQVQTRDKRRAHKSKVRTDRTASSPNATSPPDIAESSTTAATRSLFIPEKQRDRYKALPELPEWHRVINIKGHRIKEIRKNRPASYLALDALKDCITRCEAEKDPSRRKKLYDELRHHVHKAQTVLKVNQYIVRDTRILTLENGLCRIFRGDAKFPSDLKADAFQLYSLWCHEVFEQDILRGIITVKGRDRGADRLDQAYKSKHPASPKFYGEGDLVLGHWWPSQLCTVRDGAHGATQGGIFGEKDKGAYSIVLSGGGGYHDHDDGDTIEYSGTEGKNGKASENTQHLIKSRDLQNEIRVIRSSQLVKTNRYRPKCGLRYDGLYKVTDYWLVNQEKQMYRFKLERCPGQDPIRCKGSGAERPTSFEVEAYEDLKKKNW